MRLIVCQRESVYVEGIRQALGEFYPDIPLDECLFTTNPEHVLQNVHRLREEAAESPLLLITGQVFATNNWTGEQLAWEVGSALPKQAVVWAYTTALVRQPRFFDQIIPKPPITVNEASRRLALFIAQAFQRHLSWAQLKQLKPDLRERSLT